MHDSEGKFILCGVIFFILCIVGIMWFNYYSADVQAGVYRRQGVNISTWEVMMGAKPIERVITVKQ